MTTREFCTQVSRRLRDDKGIAGVSRDLVMQVMAGCVIYAKDMLAEGDDLTVPGFGKFSVEFSRKGSTVLHDPNVPVDLTFVPYNSTIRYLTKRAPNIK